MVRASHFPDRGKTPTFPARGPSRIQFIRYACTARTSRSRLIPRLPTEPVSSLRCSPPFFGCCCPRPSCRRPRRRPTAMSVVGEVAGAIARSLRPLSPCSGSSGGYLVIRKITPAADMRVWGNQLQAGLRGAQGSRFCTASTGAPVGCWRARQRLSPDRVWSASQETRDHSRDGLTPTPRLRRPPELYAKAEDRPLHDSVRHALQGVPQVSGSMGRDTSGAPLKADTTYEAKLL